MSVARQLAERVCALRYEDLPAEAVYWSKVAVLDTVGVTVAGAMEAAPRITEEVAQPGSGPSLILARAGASPRSMRR
jgi:2-methylcitrate dehydratase PrpD